MNYKQTLYFIATCLTISLIKKNRLLIKNKLISDNINWDLVVKVSSTHLVLPALYSNLKRAHFLKYLPKDLVNYMLYISNLNLERNMQIITQANELNKLLISKNIIPIFLKGTANLLVELYDDLNERMVGDIDFIVSKNDYHKAIKVLTDNGYYCQNKETIHKPFRHYNRLIKKDNIAAVEVHKELLLDGCTTKFNFDFIKKDSLIINDFTVMSYNNIINLSILSNQINDSAYYYKNISLRNAYDVLTLSKKINTKDAISKLPNHSDQLNFFLAVCYELFNNAYCIKYKNSKKTANNLITFKKKIANINKSRRKDRQILIYLIIKSKLNFIYKAILNKDYRDWLFIRLNTKKWYINIFKSRE